MDGASRWIREIHRPTVPSAWELLLAGFCSKKKKLRRRAAIAREGPAAWAQDSEKHRLADSERRVKGQPAQTQAGRADERGTERREETRKAHERKKDARNGKGAQGKQGNRPARAQQRHVKNDEEKS